MNTRLIAITTAALLAGSAHAQAGSHNPAVKDSTARTTAVAAKGRNSFTEAQAQGRMAKAGYADVSKLAKNRNRVWQGTATKNGAKVNVALDYKGNVTVH